MAEAELAAMSTAEMDDLRRDLRLVMDRQEISALRARYAAHAARGEWDAMAEMFTPDAVFEATMPHAASGTLKTHRSEGREAVRAGFKRQNAKVVPLVNNELTEVEGDRAHGQCTMVSVVRPTPNARFIGIYEDAFERADGRWWFTLRRFTVLDIPL